MTLLFNVNGRPLVNVRAFEIVRIVFFFAGQRTHIVFVLGFIEIHGQLLELSTTSCTVLIFLGVIFFVFDYHVGLVQVLKVRNFLDQILV